jgi:hypothetical protein
MPVPPSLMVRDTRRADARRTAIAFVSATLISIAVLALLAIFDVK